MNSKLASRFTIVLFATTIFFSAFLLFQVQPIMAKYILPWFGGSPGVWTTCMLVFQVLLFGGYAYAFVLNRYLTLQKQIVLHCCLLLLATFTLPITPTADWKPHGEDSPAWMIMLLLLCKVGAPYFLLSSTGPLLQSWLGQSNACREPYRLYSLSNVGSMLALLSFPFAIEPMLSSTEQSMFWSIAFVSFAVLCGLSGTVLYRASTAKSSATDSPEEVQTIPLAAIVPTRWSTIWAWFALSMLPSVMLLATTNQVCLDTGVIPFLWVIPLAIYLLSFILTFESERWYSRRPYIMASTISFLVLYLLKLVEYKTPLVVELCLYFSGLFCACMVCHGELVKLKPHPTRLTSFYMTLSAGGACGGIFVGLLAPVMFNGYFEWQLGLLACIMVFLESYLQSNSYWRDRVPATTKIAIAMVIPLVAVSWLSLWNSISNKQLAVKRNFYGVMSVTNARDEVTGESIRNLVHGRIVHGSQFQQENLQQNPTAYYTKSSGVGIAMQNHNASRPRHIGVVGLGAGTLATYGREGDRFRFYEINPHVIEMAKEYFTFLSGTKADVDLVLGDARLTLEREEDQRFDILVLDAFSGDAIPIHLLTREAMSIYIRHLNEDGVLAIHISNLYFDLQSIVAGLAMGDSLETTVIAGEANASLGALTSTWVLLSKKGVTLQNALGATQPMAPIGKPIFWTDDRSNLFEALR
jgi:spermidine synthase